MPGYTYHGGDRVRVDGAKGTVQRVESIRPGKQMLRIELDAGGEINKTNDEVTYEAPRP